MDKTTLILMMVSLLVLFIVLVTAYVIMGRSKKAVQPTENEEVVVTFEMMRSVINHASASNAELNHAVNTIIEDYGNITEGERSLEVYESLLEMLCIHKNTDSKIILRFQKALRNANPKFRGEIEKALKLGLSERDKR